jgi:tetratricopeptide (TPR) repeat protein
MSFFNFLYSKKPSLETLLSFGLSFLILLYAFSPFWFGSRFAFQNQAGLLVGITALSTIGCAIILIKHIFTSNRPKTFTQLDLLLSVYLVYLLIQMLFYPISKEYILQLICLVSVYFLFRQLSSQSVTILLFLLPVLAVFQIVYGYSHLAEPWQGLSDITGGFGNTGIFGGFVAMGFVAALGLHLSPNPSPQERGKEKPNDVLMLKISTHCSPLLRRRVGGEVRKRIFLLILLIPLTIQLFYTQSRAAWLAAIIGTAALLLPSVFRKLKKVRSKSPLWGFGGSFLLLLIGIFLSISLYHFKKDSADGRILIWTVSSKMTLEKPITGFGVNGFQKNYLLYQGEYFKNNPDSPYADLADNSSSPFNEWLKIGVKQGIIGLLFVFGILFTAFRYSAHSPPLRAVLTALVVFACFSYPFEFVAFQMLGIFCLANVQSPALFGTQMRRVIADCHCGLNPQSLRCLRGFRVKHGMTRRIRVICVPLIILACGFIIYFSHNYFTGIKEWNRAFYAYSSEERTDKFQILYPDLKHDALFLSVYGRILYDAGRYDEAIPVLETAITLFPSAQTFMLLGDAYEKTGTYQKALKSWETALYIMPVLFTPHYNMAKLYLKLGDSERAKQKAEEILNKRIKINSPRIVRMKQEMRILLERNEKELPSHQDSSLIY